MPRREGFARMTSSSLARQATLALVLLPAVAGCAHNGENDFLELSIAHNTMRVEVLRTPEDRADGYFTRPEPGPGEGLLFVFERPDNYAFIMSDGRRSVAFPLGIAFVDAYGRITQIERLAPNDPQPVRSSEPVLYAVEGSWQYFQDASLRTGMIVEGLPKVSSD